MRCNILCNQTLPYPLYAPCSVPLWLCPLNFVNFWH